MKIILQSMLILFVFCAFINEARSQKQVFKPKAVLKIGSQIWMEENLDVVKFRNGDGILKATSMKMWREADDNKVAAWCFPDFKNSNAHLGRLYNVHAVNDSRELAPKGWSIPTDYDWDALVNYLGNELDGGKKLVSVSRYKKNKELDSKGSFLNKSTGWMNLDGFWGTSTSSIWWSSTGETEYKWVRGTYKHDGHIVRYQKGNWGDGFAIRCIKTITSIDESEFYSENYKPNDTAFNSIVIGSQIWSAKNLSTKIFRNGDTIQYVDDYKNWMKANETMTPAWCYYADRPINGNNYGILYNWYAIADPRGLAPVGWHIPSLNEWEVLIKKLGGETSAGCELKKKSPINESGNDKKSFDLLSAGGRNMYGAFHLGLGGSTAFWTSTESSLTKAYCIYSGDSYSGDSCLIMKSNTEKTHGYYVRCIKD